MMIGKNWLESNRITTSITQGVNNDEFVVFTLKKEEKPIEEFPLEMPEETKEDKPKEYKRSKPVEEVKDEPIDFEALETMELNWNIYTKVDETRKNVNIVFIGHVDCGKSTTCGHILFLTGKVDEADIRKYEQEAKEKQRDSWFWAYVMDINPEEREKGKTVEVGKAHFTTKSRRFVLLDAPGHKNYVPNMLAGASQADVAVLVISAKTGEFESGFEKDGQTKEHALLARSLGVSELICAVNKMDEVGWSQKRFDEIRTAVEPFLRENCNYDTEKIKWIPYSGLHGPNLKDRVDKSICPWYDGPSLLEYMDTIETEYRDPKGPVRIPILDKFKDQGTYIFGKVESGTIKEDQMLTLMPYKFPVQIKQIFNSEDQRLYYAKPGENIKLCIKGAEDDFIRRGFMITSNANRCMICAEFEAELDILEIPEHKHIMSSGYACVIHIHSAMEEISLKTVISEIDKKTGKETKIKFLKSWMRGKVIMEARIPLCLEKYDMNQHLGRFTLRDSGKTIAVGKVLKVKPYVAADSN